MFNVKDRDLVIPGQMLAEKQRCGTGTIKEDGNVYAAVKGQARIDGQEVKIIPLEGVYIPRMGDVVIGVVENILPGRWELNINCPYNAKMRAEEKTENPFSEDLSKFFTVGDILSIRVDQVNEVYDTNVVKPWRLEGGCIIKIVPKRIPRVVGKKKSMLNMIRDKTGCKMSVGQNGLVWVRGDNMDVVIKALKKIEREAHIRGLTDSVSKMIDEEMKNRKEVQIQNNEEEK
ncbi:exosome complex RNA-binding protein Rrp4 [Candidatus Altiarchaeota archaeon]